jgi:hypothetical protein
MGPENERSGQAFAQPLRRGAFVSGKTTPHLKNVLLFEALHGVPRRDKDEIHHPSMAAIKVALPPAAVVSMQVTRSVAKRAT